MISRNTVKISIIIAGVILIAIVTQWYIKVAFQKPKEAPAIEPGVDVDLPLEEGFESIANARGLLAEGNRAQAIRLLEETISTTPDPKEAYESLNLLSSVYREDDNLIKTKETYKMMQGSYSDYSDPSELQEKIGEINIELIHSPRLTQDSESYTVKPGDSLAKIARQYNTTIALIKNANNLKSDIITPGMKLKVQRVSYSVVVDKSESVLRLILRDEVIKTYPVSTGMNNSTPIGAFKINQDKLIDPVWYSPEGVVPSGDPNNVLGTRWMGITTPEPGYGIHGTNDPTSIGYQCTEGCVRMYNAGVEELYDILPVGTEVTIID